MFLANIESKVANERLEQLYKLYEGQGRQIKILEALVKHFQCQNYTDSQLNMAKQKMRHILAVPICARKIAESEKITGEELFMVDAAALLHDWGRLYDIKHGQFKNLGHPQAGAKDLFEDGKIINIIDNRQYDKILKFSVFMHGMASVPEALKKHPEYAEIAKRYPCAERICQITRVADRWANNEDFLLEPFSVILSNAPTLRAIWGSKVDNTTRYELTHGLTINRSAEGVEYTPLRQLASHIGWAFADDNLPSYIKWLYQTRWPEKYALMHVPNDPAEIEGLEEQVEIFMNEVIPEVMKRLKEMISR